jgi:outer membrane protein OmpA-like peptidoglycan-associated protein
MKWAIGAGMQEYNTDRTVEIGTNTYNPQGKFQTTSIKGSGEAEIELFGPNKDFTVNPVLGVQAAYIMNEQIEETEGGVTNLIVSGGAYARLSGTFGLRFKGEGESDMMRWNIYIYGGYIMLGAPHDTYEMKFKEAQEYGTMSIRAGDESQAFGGLSAGYEKDIWTHFSVFINGDIKIDPNNEESILSGFSVAGGFKIKFGTLQRRERPAKPEPEPKPAPKPEPKPQPIPEPEEEEDEEEEAAPPKDDFSELDNLSEEMIVALLAELEGTNPKEDEQKMIQEAQDRRKNLLQSFRLSAATFKSGSSQLSDQSKDDIRKLVQNLKAYDYKKVTVEGHTDSSGNAAKNKTLSQQRAKVVYDQLIQNGIPRSKLAFVGFGSLMPIAPNTTPKNKERNRRVEIFIE